MNHQMKKSITTAATTAYSTAGYAECKNCSYAFTLIWHSAYVQIAAAEKQECSLTKILMRDLEAKLRL